MLRRDRLPKPCVFPTCLLGACLVLLLCSPFSLYARDADTPVPVVHIDGADYVALTELARATDGHFYDAPRKHKVELRFGGHTCVFTSLSSAIAIDDEAYRLPLPTRYLAGGFYISAEVLPLLSRVAGASYRAQSGTTAPSTSAGSRAVAAPAPPQVAPVQPPVEPGVSRPAPVPAPQKPAPDVAAHAANWTLNTVIIDPGHGGEDPGATGRGGTHEKAVVLDVAKRLKKLLEKELGVNVVLTRHDDTFIPLRKRSQIALQQGGKIFVSLHCNANPNHDASGLEVYFLSEAKTKEAATVAQRENAAIDYEKNDPQFPLSGVSEAYQKMALSLLSTHFLKESQDLAADVGREIAKDVPGIKQRGVKQANFFVMRYTMAQMPSVLVELGFITNRAEEKRLRSGSYQQKLAEALCRGIGKFKQRYEQQLSATN